MARSSRRRGTRWPSGLRTALIAGALLLTSCFSGAGPAATSPSRGVPGAEAAPPVPDLDARLVAAGEPLYQRYCASCHGADLAGNPDWKTPNEDGSLEPPPQDSTGHTWHHSDGLLLELIATGIDDPISRMPRFGTVLGDDQIASIVEYIKSSWGREERAFQWMVTWQEEQTPRD